MAIDSVTVGSNEREIGVIGDPVTAANRAAVLAMADALSLSGKYAVIAGSPLLLLNSGGTYDLAREFVGATGIQAVSIEGTRATFSVGSSGITPAATATDILTLYGSGTKTVRVSRIKISGTATSAATADILLVRRSTTNSGGTASNPTKVTHDTNDSAATATISLYSANPTTGTSVGTLRASKLNLGAAGAAGEVVWDFTLRNTKAVVLRGTSEGIAINWNGAAVPSGTSLTIEIEWVEDAS